MICVILHPHVSPPEIIFACINRYSAVMSEQTPPQNEAFLCVRIEFALVHVHLAGRTTSRVKDAPILRNDSGQLHEINTVSFWPSPDVGTSLLCGPIG